VTDLTFIGTFNENDGYGRMSIHLARALCRAGVDVEAVSIYDIKRHRTFKRPVISATSPDTWGKITGKPFWGLTMWESSKLPESWVEWINQDGVDGVIVPSEFNRQVFIESGIEKSVAIVPLGVDAGEYPYVERPVGRRPYTFLLLGELGGLRKGVPYAYQAFWQAFKGNGNARLILKTRGNDQNLPTCGDANVEIINAEYGWEMMKELYRAADCFVFPSRGEGYGLPPREAASTGLPVIATDWSGLQEGGIENYALPLKVKRMITALYGPPEIHAQVGVWAEPDVDELAWLMRWCYEHQAEAKEKGRRASEWIKANCTWEQGAKVLMEAVNGRS